MQKRRLVASAALACALLAPSASTTAVGFATNVQGVGLGGSGSPQTGAFTPSGASDVTDVEFPDGMDSGAGPSAFTGTITARSLSRRGGDRDDQSGAHGDEGDRGIDAPRFVNGWEGLNHFQQRFSRGGNQFSLEPPDQGLCVGNGFVLETTNDVINIFNPAGKSVLPDNTATNIVARNPTDVGHAVDLNSFFGYQPAVNRATGIVGQFVTDPSCLFDTATQRFFLVVLTLETFPTTGKFTHVNHLDLAVSKTSDPTGQWNIYRTDVTNDGGNAGGKNPCPCLGDYPHMGADANGIYITTNAYPWATDGFDGAQIYAFSKKQLAAGAAVVNMQHINTFGLVHAPSDAGATQPGFTLWPAQSPGGHFDHGDRGNGGTEFFLSSNAADEANVPVVGSGGPHTSKQLIVWSLTNTASLNSTPALQLTNKILGVGQYAVPPSAKQPGSDAAPTQAAPQGFCINDIATLLFDGKTTGCWKLLFAKEPKHDEIISRPDSNDTRMQQVTFTDGKLVGALDTALTAGGVNRAGIEWFVVDVNGRDSDDARLDRSGYLGASGMDLTYPAIGVNRAGRGVMTFTAMGDTTFPSAAFAPFDAHRGSGAWRIVNGGLGAAQDDGFTGYKSQTAPDPKRPRWGDYGAAAVDGNSIWIASEYIAHACSYKDWGGPFFAGGTGDNKLGTCAPSAGAAGPRTALANWSTRISHFTLGDDDR